MAKLFLSYAHEDAVKARQLQRLLEAGGHSVWWDDSIKGGESFSREIEQALAGCDAVLALWSRISVDSSWVRDEAAIGRDAGKLVPVSLDETPQPLGFRQLQSIDLTGWNGRRKPARWDRILQSIAAVTSRATGVEAQQPEATPSTRPRIAPTRPAVIIGSLSLVVAATGLFLWRSVSDGPSVTIAVVPSQTLGDRKTNSSYAASISSDIATLLAAQAQDASVLDPSSGEPHGDDFRVNVAIVPHGKAADASTSLSVPRERRIIWSKDWTVADVTKTDLKQQMAFAASRALQCALGGVKGGLQKTLVNIYVTACAEFSSGDEANGDLERLYSKLVQQAPDFAPAWADLAVIYGGRALNMIYQDQPVPAELKRRALTAIHNARRLNPNSGKAFMAEGALAGKDRLKHLALMERAVEVEPNTSLLHRVLAYHLRTVGRMNESLGETERAIALDPLSSGDRAAYLYALAFSGRFGAVRDEFAKAQSTWPNSLAIRDAGLVFHLNYGDPKRAESMLSASRASETYLARLLAFLRAREDPTPANIAAAIAAYRSAAAADALNVGEYLSVLATFGKTDDAFAILRDRKYLRRVESDRLFLPEFRKIREDVRFMAVAAELGLVKYWTVSGHWPDYCSAPGLAYNCVSEARKYVARD